MTDDEKREHAEAIKCALGMGGYGPPMEGEAGWVPPEARRAMASHLHCGGFVRPVDPWRMRIPVRGIDAGPGVDGVVPPARRITQARTAEEDKAWLEQIEGQPIKVHVREFQSNAPARREDMEAFAAELRANPEKARRFFCEAGLLAIVKDAAMTIEDADDEIAELDRTAEERAENAQAVIDAIREAKERRMAKELAEKRAKAADKPTPPSDDPWAVVGKAEDDGDELMKKIRDFG